LYQKWKKKAYRRYRQDDLKDVSKDVSRDVMEAADMSGINVAFVSSVPGSNKDGSMCLWGHRAVAKLLRTHLASHVSSWPVVAQCYSIGSLGLMMMVSQMADVFPTAGPLPPSSHGSRYMKRMQDLHQDRLLTLRPPILHADLGQPVLGGLGQRQQGRHQLPHHEVRGGCGLAAIPHNWPRHLHRDLLHSERGRE